MEKKLVKLQKQICSRFEDHDGIAMPSHQMQFSADQALSTMYVHVAFAKYEVDFVYK